MVEVPLRLYCWTSTAHQEIACMTLGLSTENYVKCINAKIKHELCVEHSFNTLTFSTPREVMFKVLVNTPGGHEPSEIFGQPIDQIIPF